MAQPKTASASESAHETKSAKTGAKPATPPGPLTLPQLPFAKDALEPIISKETIDFHYGKHHSGYVKKANELLANSPLRDLPLEEIVRKSDGKLFNQTAQVWNHNFFWQCLQPVSSAKPKGELNSAIEKSFGSFDKFKEEFSTKAVELFGSGWVWLIQRDDGQLEIVGLPDAQNPLTKPGRALLTLDVWEHAYYIDYRNERKEFIDGFWKLVNWDFVTANLATH